MGSSSLMKKQQTFRLSSNLRIGSREAAEKKQSVQKSGLSPSNKVKLQRDKGNFKIWAENLNKMYDTHDATDQVMLSKSLQKYKHLKDQQ